MSEFRLPALTIADDSAKPWRFEFDMLLYACINHIAAAQFLGIPRTDVRLYKPSAGDVRAIEFRIGEPGADTVDGSSLEFAVRHNASGGLDVFNGSGNSISIDNAGNVTIPSIVIPTILTGTLTHDPPSIPDGDTYEFTITVTGAATTNTPTVIATPSINIEGSGVFIVGARVISANTVEVTYYNQIAGVAVNLGSHTVRATVFNN